MRIGTSIGFALTMGLGGLFAGSSCGVKTVPPNMTDAAAPIPPPVPPAPQDAVIVTKPVVLVKTLRVGTEGETLVVTEATSPLQGLAITFPPGALLAPADISIAYADIDLTASKIPADTTVLSKVLVLTSSSNVEFAKPVVVKLPYTVSLAKFDELVSPYEYVTATVGTLTATKLDAATVVSRAAGSISFAVRHFSSFLVLEWAKTTAEILGPTGTFTIDTGFWPGSNGWFLANYGSVLNPAGNALGMTSYAKWLYTWRGLLSESKGLFEKYRSDDQCALEAASRMQLGQAAIWSGMTAASVGRSSLDTAKSVLQAMRDTGQPQMLFASQRYDNGTLGNGHVVLVTGYKSGVFTVYDPNVPGDVRSISYTYNGDWSHYDASRGLSSERFTYNVFGHLGATLFYRFEDAYTIYKAAETAPCFKDPVLYPVVTLTAPSEAKSDGKLAVQATNEVGVTLVGTVTGKRKQPARVLLYVNGVRFELRLAAGGVFQQKMPLFCTPTVSSVGAWNLNTQDNVVEFLAFDETEWEVYAGYARYVLSCTGPTALMKVTLTWSTPLDLDLHAGIPDGRDVGYQGLNWLSPVDSTAPYLDYDDAVGTGPEHLFFDRAQPLQQGNYAVRVHYLAKGVQETAPAVGYSVRVDRAFVMSDGAPKFEAPWSYSGTLLAPGQTETVTALAYPLTAPGGLFP